MGSREDIIKVITFYLKYATTVRNFFVFFGILAVIGGLIGADDTDGISILFGAIGCVIFVGNGIILENAFKWKAYMLQNTLKD